MNLEMKLENGWVIVVEQDNTPSVMTVDDGRNHSKVLVWAYNPNISEYSPIKDSGLTVYHKRGYRNKESLELPTGFMWMGVETLKNRIKQQFS